MFVEDRLIPTCMGNTSAPLPMSNHKTVNPHVHGEHGRVPASVMVSFG